MEQPDECFDPIQFAVDLDSEQQTSTVNVDKNEKVYISKGLIHQANGSSYIELASTKVTCAIYGPRETSSSTDESYSKCLLETSIKFAPFARRQRIDPLIIQYDNDEDTEEAELCSRLEEAL